MFDTQALSKLLNQDALSKKLSQMLFGKGEQIALMEELASLVPYIAPLKALINIEKYAHGPRKMAAKSMINSIQSGQSIAGGMDGWFDPILIEAVRVGESSGNLAVLIKKTIESLRIQQAGVSKSLMLIAYPLFIFVMAVMATVMMHDTFMPLVTSMSKGAQLPPDLMYVEKMGRFIKNWSMPILTGMIVGVMGIYWVIINYTGHYRDQLDKLPVFRHYSWTLGARFMMMYSILKSMAQTESRILEVASRNGSPYYKAKLNYMLRRVQSGKSIDKVLDTGLIAPKNIERLQLLSATQEYADALEQASISVMQETAKKINMAARLIFIIGMVVNALLIGKLILAGMAVDQISFT